MGWFTGRNNESSAGRAHAPTHVGSPMKYVPSFNDFLGDNPGLELEADHQMQQQQTIDAQQVWTRPGGEDTPKIPSLTPVAATQGAPAVKIGDSNPWRSVFDPGHNPNLHRVGRQYYDTVNDRFGEPSVWEYIVQAEQLNKGSFEDMDRGRKGYLDREDLTAAFDGKYGDARGLVDQADVNRDGKIDREEFKRVVEGTGVDDLTSQGGVAWTE